MHRQCSRSLAPFRPLCAASARGPLQGYHRRQLPRQDQGPPLPQAAVHALRLGPAGEAARRRTAVQLRSRHRAASAARQPAAAAALASPCALSSTRHCDPSLPHAHALASCPSPSPCAHSCPPAHLPRWTALAPPSCPPRGWCCSSCTATEVRSRDVPLLYAMVLSLLAARVRLRRWARLVSGRKGALGGRVSGKGMSSRSMERRGGECVPNVRLRKRGAPLHRRAAGSRARCQGCLAGGTEPPYSHLARRPQPRTRSARTCSTTHRAR